MTSVRSACPAIFLFAALSCFGQASAFEVASVRSSPNVANDLDEVHNGQVVIKTSPGTLTIRGASLKLCIEWAFDVPPFQIEGPDWLKEIGFDIVAKAAEPVDDDHLRLMLRTLLAGRFGVKTHTEKKEMQVYKLTLAKGGPKFHESTTEGPPSFSNQGRASLLAERVTMGDLAEKISEPLGRPVMDSTGLKGRYDIHIDASAYIAAAGGNGGGQMDVMSLLFTALQQQLGVKLESRKDTPEILIVDSVEKTPTEN